jgi:hypothetical protein
MSHRSRILPPLLAAFGGLVPAVASAAEPAVKRGALVFDDGPRPADAEPLLALLAKEKVHATFSLVGDRVNENPETAKVVAAAGHEIVNHSQTHAHPRDLDDAGLPATRTADNGNGTFTNPLFYDEFSDPNLIRVGEDYYLTGTTMHAMPGLPVLHSRDLVNWRLLGYAFDRLDLGPEFRLEDGKEIYGQGVWAPCLRYHNGTFHIFTNINRHATHDHRQVRRHGRGVAFLQNRRPILHHQRVVYGPHAHGRCPRRHGFFACKQAPT